MSRDGLQNRRVIFGGLLISGLFALALLIFFSADIIDAFRSRYRIVAILAAAPGLTEDAPVWVGGKAAGTVKQIAFMPFNPDSTATIAVEIELPRGIASQVRADSRVRLTTARMIGPPVIDILPGTGGAPVLGPGDTLRQARGITAAELTSRAAVLRADLDTVLADVNALTPLIGARMRDARIAMDGARLAMAEAGTLTGSLQNSPGAALLRDPRFGASIRSAQNSVAALPSMLDRLRGQMTGEAGVPAALARLRVRADSLNVQLAELSAMLDSPNGSAARFRQDTAIVRALNGARAQLDSLMIEARQNPMRFVF